MIVDFLATVILAFFAIVVLAVGVTLAAIFGFAFLMVAGVFNLGMWALNAAWRVR